jgi:cytosine/adenosine deaminase-related metal-dependent hydrolase
MDKTIGSLQPGKQADFCVIDLSQTSTIPVTDPETAIVFSTSAANILATTVAGDFLYDRGEINSVDGAQIKRKFLTTAAKLM